MECNANLLLAKHMIEISCLVKLPVDHQLRQGLQAMQMIYTICINEFKEIYQTKAKVPKTSTEYAF